MKKLLALCLVCLMFTGCVAKEPENMYDILLMPEGVEFGMNTHEVANAIGLDNELPEAGVSKMTHIIYVDLGHHCMLRNVEYRFEKGEKIEFEDTHKLIRIDMHVRDMIPQEDRRKDFHGDIEAEYENIKAYFTEIYGEPSRDREGPTPKGDVRDAKWDNVNGGFLIMTLEDLTGSVRSGSIGIVYRDGETFDTEEW